MNSKLKIIIAVVVIVLIVLIVVPGIYFAGNVMLANNIKSNYQAKNCGQVLSMDNFYNSVYPAPVADQSLSALANECALYSLAVENEGKNAWQDAYNTYQVYLHTYPKGLFVNEAQEHSAVALMAQAKEQLAAKKYNDAIGTINHILQDFGKTGAAKEAAGLMSEVYLTWAKGQRDASDFAGTEGTLKTFKAWAEKAARAEDVKSAQRELAQTYLAWGLAFQTQKQFESAKAKFDQTIAADPEPLAASGPAAQAKAATIKLYITWGDTFLEKNDFTNAIDRYQTVVTLSEAKDQPPAQDRISGVYLKWAANMSASEDFLGALGKIDEAAKSAATDVGKKSAESATADTYTAFSKSSGAQAKKAMKDAIKSVCENNKKPDLPIFGLNKERILSGIYGVEDTLPDNVLAKTPGELHYVSCVVMSTETLQTMIFYWATFVREKYTWNVSLRQVSTGDETAKTKIVGGTPPPLPKLTYSNFLDYLFGGWFYRSRGSNPDVTALATWLLTVMK
jgi:tetratricopeptide (TPR) repeat protein